MKDFYRSTPAQRAAAKQWRTSHPERVIESSIRQQARIKSSPELLERRRATYRRCYERNKEKHVASHRAWLLRNPSAKIADRLRSQLRMIVKGRQQRSSIEVLLGCSCQQFRDHLATLFQPGMCWANHGTHWVIDHIRPCSSFDLTNPEQRAICFHYLNTQPMAKRANQIKYNRLQVKEVENGENL